MARGALTTQWRAASEKPSNNTLKLVCDNLCAESCAHEVVRGPMHLALSGPMRLMRLTVSSLLAAASLLVGQAAQPDGYWDSRFFLPGINGVVNAIAVSGNDLYAGGLFSSADNLAVTNLARWNGTNWAALNGGVNGEVKALALWGNDLFVGGNFTVAGGVTASRIAKWNGSGWNPLGSGIGGANVAALAVDAAGALYVGGEFTNAGGVAVANIAKWDGTNWTALGSGLSNDPYAAWVLALAVGGNDLYAGGFFTDAGGVSVSCIARWNGTIWTSLDSGVDDRDYLPQVTALAVGGNDLYVGGAFTQAGNVSAAQIAKWDGANWSALGPGLTRFFGDIPVTTLAVSGEHLLVGGRFLMAGGVPANNLALWDGNAWSELGGGASDAVKAIAVAATGVWLGGNFIVANGPTPAALARWNGAQWNVPSAGGGKGFYGPRTCTTTCVGDDIAALAVSGNTLYAAGGFTVAGGMSILNVARWDGTNWRPLGSGIAGQVSGLCLIGTELIAGGQFNAAGGMSAMNIARWNGTNWAALGGGVGGPVYALATSDGQLYAGGAFGSAGGVNASNVARWDGAGWFALAGGLNGPVYALAASSNALYVGGKFTVAGDVGATNIARWDGSSWTALGGGVGGFVNLGFGVRPPPVSALLLNGNDLYVGGDFAFAGSVRATKIARWDGTNWSALGGGVLGASAFSSPRTVHALVMSSRALYAGGSFTTVGGLPISNVARWDGANWSALDERMTGGGITPPPVEALAVSGDELYLGGHFEFAGGKPSANFAIWQPPPALSLRRVGNVMELSWFALTVDYVLQASENLSPNSWREVTNVPARLDDRLLVLTPAAGHRQFYRLKSP